MTTAPQNNNLNLKEFQMHQKRNQKVTSSSDPAQEHRAPAAAGDDSVADRIASMPGSPIARRRAWSRHRWGRRFDFQQVRGFNIVTTVAA